MITTSTTGTWPTETFSTPGQMIVYPRRIKSWPLPPVPPTVSVPMKVYSEEEVLSILFPTARDRKRLADAEKKHDDEIRSAIKAGEINPIRGWRIIRGVDQKELARLTGLKQPNISRMEKLGARAEVPNLKKIAEALQIGIEELIP